MGLRVLHLAALETFGRGEIPLLHLTSLWIPVIASLERRVFRPLPFPIGPETRRQYRGVFSDDS